MLTVKDYILTWTIFKLCNTLIINNDRLFVEGKRTNHKDNFNEFIKQSKKVITLLNEDILRSNKILDKIAADSNRIDQMSGFEDQQIKKIEAQLESKVLSSLGSAQLIDENIFQLNEDSNLKLDQTTNIRIIPVLKKKISSKALQGLYRHVFSHISLQESTQRHSHGTSVTTSLLKHSEVSTAKAISNIETSIISLGNNSEGSTTQPFSSIETSAPNLENQSEASATPLVSNSETFTISSYSHSESITTTTSKKEPSAVIRENRSESSTSLNNEPNLPQLIATGKSIPLHHMNHSHICIDLSEVCNDNETREHILKNSEENPDLKAKTDTPPPTEKVTTIPSTTRKSLYPSELTLSKTASPIVENKSTARPLPTLAHMEFIGQVSCRWVCDSQNVTLSSFNEAQKEEFRSSATSDSKVESSATQISVVPLSTTLEPSVIQVDISSTAAITTSNKSKMQRVVHLSANNNRNVSSHECGLGVQGTESSTCEDPSQTYQMPEGITMTCVYTDLPTTTPVVCTSSSPTPEPTVATKPHISVLPEMFTLTTPTTPEISDLPEKLLSTSDSPDISDMPEKLLSTPPPETTTERTTEKSPVYGSMHTTKVQPYFLFRTTNNMIQKLSTIDCDPKDINSRSFLFNDLNCEEQNLTTCIRDYLFPFEKHFSNKQLLKEINPSEKIHTQTQINGTLNGKTVGKYSKLNGSFDFRDLFDSFNAMSVSPDVSKTSSAENTSLRIIYKNIKINNLKVTTCNLEDINRYFRSEDNCTEEMLKTPDECETTTDCEIITECETTECEIGTPALTTECVTVNYETTTECEPLNTTLSTNVPASFITSKKSMPPTTTISTTTLTTKIPSTTIPTTSPSTTTLSTTNHTLPLTTTNITSTSIHTSETTSKKFSSTSQKTTNNTSTIPPTTEMPTTKSTNETEKHSSPSDEQQTAVNLSLKTTVRSTASETEMHTSISNATSNSSSPPTSTMTICIPSTCPTEKNVSTVNATTICVPVTCPENVNSTKETSTIEKTINELKNSPLVDLLITIPVFIEKQTTTKKKKLFKKYKYDNIVPQIRNLVSTMKNDLNTMNSPHTFMDDYDLRASKSYLSKAKKKQNDLLKKPKKPLEIFILDPNLALWRQGLKSLIRHAEG